MKRVVAASCRLMVGAAAVHVHAPVDESWSLSEAVLAGADILFYIFESIIGALLGESTDRLSLQEFERICELLQVSNNRSARSLSVVCGVRWTDGARIKTISGTPILKRSSGSVANLLRIPRPVLKTILSFLNNPGNDLRLKQLKDLGLVNGACSYREHDAVEPLVLDEPGLKYHIPKNIRIQFSINGLGAQPNKTDQLAGIKYSFKIKILGSLPGRAYVLTQKDEPGHTNGDMNIRFKSAVFPYRYDMTRVQIWDSSRVPPGCSIMWSLVFRNTQAFVFLYDVTCEQSYQHINNLLHSHLSSGATRDGTYLDSETNKFYLNPWIVKVVVGHKRKQKSHDRKISYQQGESLAKKFDMPFQEVETDGSQNDQDVQDMYDSLVEEVFERVHLMKKLGSNVLMIEQDRGKLIATPQKPLDPGQEKYSAAQMIYR